MIYNVNRIGGLASGMDIDQMVFDLMKAERMRADKLFQQKQIMEWQKQDYRDINLKLRTFYNSTFDMKLSSSYLKYKVNGTLPDGSAIDTYFSATAGASAMPGSYKMKVDQLASAARLEGSATLSRPLTGNVIDLPVVITEENNSVDITVNGVKKTITLEKGSYYIYTLRTALQKGIDDAFGGGKVTVGVDEGRLTFEPSKEHKFDIRLNRSTENGLDLSKIGFSDGDGFPINLYRPLLSKNADGNYVMSEAAKFRSSIFETEDPEERKITVNINGETLEFDFSEKVELDENGEPLLDDDGNRIITTGAHINYSLGDIFSKINSNENLGVRVQYDAVTDKVVFVSKKTGEVAKVELGESNFIKALGFNFNEEGKVITKDGKVANTNGTDAQIIFNGTLVEKSTNDFTLNGISFSLRQTTAEEVTFTVAQDVDTAVDNIKKYVEFYNETIDAINKKLSEERHRKFPPLTDAQKAEMKESDIKQWEEKARSGMLRSEPMLTGLLAKMREAIYTPIQGLPEGMNTLASIGIGTKQWYEMGKLHIDEDKLRDALAKDPEAVMRMFNATGESIGEKGVAARLYDIVKTGMDNVIEKAGGGEFEKVDNSILGKQIRDMEKRISDFEEKMFRLEERYWRQFTAMEQAIQAMNQQSMWLATQMGLGGGGY